MDPADASRGCGVGPAPCAAAPGSAPPHAAWGPRRPALQSPRAPQCTGLRPLTCAQPAPVGAASPAAELDGVVLPVQQVTSSPCPRPGLAQRHTVPAHALPTIRPLRPAGAPDPARPQGPRPSAGSLAALTSSCVRFSSALSWAAWVARCSALHAATELPTSRTVTENPRPSGTVPNQHRRVYYHYHCHSQADKNGLRPAHPLLSWEPVSLVRERFPTQASQLRDPCEFRGVAAGLAACRPELGSRAGSSLLNTGFTF